MSTHETNIAASVHKLLAKPLFCGMLQTGETIW